MPIPGRHSVLLAMLVALLAAGVGVPPRAAVASSGADEGHGRETITTVLYPGWNLVGWVEPDTPTAKLFEAIPSLRQVSSWDPEVQGYRRAHRNRYAALPALTQGMGLWLHLGGNSHVEWSRAVSRSSVLLALETGTNLVGWTGIESTHIADAVEPLGDALERAWIWDAQAQRYRLYVPNARRSGDLPKISSGSALRVEVGRPIRWWQPGAAKPRITFLGDIPDETREALIAEYWDVREFVARRFATVGEGKLHYVGATIDDLRVVHRAIWGTEWDPRPEVCGRTRPTVALVTLRCAHGSLGEQYVSRLLVELPGKGHPSRGAPAHDPRGPGWLIDGIEAYAVHAYRAASGDSEYTHEDFIADQHRAAREVAFPLQYFEMTENRSGPVNASERALGFLAVEWLAERAGDPAVFEYLRLMRDTADWRTAFLTVFGTGVDDFDERFATYRDEAFPPFAHLTDEATGPVLIVLDGISADRGAAMRAQFERVHQFFAERFGVGGTGYTLYVAPDATAALAAVPGWHDSRSCRRAPLHGVAVITVQYCSEPLPFAYAYIWGTVRDAHTQPIPASGSAYGTAPAWFDEGVRAYAETSYGEHAGIERAGEFRELAVTAAVFDPVTLRGTSTPEGRRLASEWTTRALGFLAVEWLASHAGDPAIFDYYRRLPEAASRGEAFEGAFGLTFEEFYEQFEAYRATLRTP